MTSPVKEVTPTAGGRRAALARYVLTTALARSADAGAAIGLILLCLERRDQLSDPILLGSVLAAATLAPHLLGPVLARRLDAAGDSRRLLALAMAGFGVFLIGATLSLGRAPSAVVIILVALAGVCGPLLTGGMSSHLTVITGADREVRRRGEGWDAVTYGLSGSVGPALVSVIAAASSAAAALIALAAASIVAGIGVLTLPRRPRGTEESAEPLRTREVIKLLGRIGPLRRTTGLTMIVSLVLGALGVLAVQLAGRFEVDPAASATLMAVFGVGNLVTSLLITLRPWRGSSETAVLWMVAGVIGGLLICAAAGSFPLAVVGFLLVGLTQGPYIAAVMSVRSENAPDGARAQVFVSMAALKVAAGALGAPLAGLLAGQGPRQLLVGGAVLVGVSGAVTLLDRRRHSKRRD